MNGDASGRRDAEALELTSIETIAATIAHEIKNPLALIKANIDFIELCDKENKYLKNYTVMKKEIERATGLLMGFNNLLQKGFETDNIINVCTAIDKLTEEYEQYDNIVIRKIPPEHGEALIKGNEEMFSMALSNIIKNAVEAIETNGEIIIEIKANAGFIEITISDNGCGMSPGIPEKLNAGISVTTKTYGNGLGVNLTKKIITAHGGTFEIKNNPAGGASVRMTFDTV